MYTLIFLKRNKGRCGVLQFLNVLEILILIVSEEFLNYDFINFIFGFLISGADWPVGLPASRTSILWSSIKHE